MINISKIGNFPVVEPNPDSIPEFLKAQPWAVWRAEPKDNQPGKFNKAPCSPVTGIKAGASKPELFGTFEQAVSALETGKYSGFGPILTGNGIVGFDIDNYKATFDQMPRPNHSAKIGASTTRGRRRPGRPWASSNSIWRSSNEGTQPVDCACT